MGMVLDEVSTEFIIIIIKHTVGMGDGGHGEAEVHCTTQSAAAVHACRGSYIHAEELSICHSFTGSTSPKVVSI